VRPGRLRSAGIPEATTWLSVVLLTAAAGAALVYAATFGRFVRPISDDWCQTGLTRRLGIGGLVDHYWHENGRVGNALIAAVVQTQFPDRQWLPAVLLIGGAGAWYFLTVTVLDVLELQVHRAVVAAACLAMVAGCLIRDGSTGEKSLQYQILFWAPGSITHTLPAVGLAVLGAIALTLRRSRWFVASLPLLFVVAALIGTVTEIFTVLLVASLVMIVVARRFHGCRADRVDVVLATGVAAMATGGAIVLLSPGLHSRTSASPLSAQILRAGQRVEPELLHRALVEPWLAVPVVCGLFLGSMVRGSADASAGSARAAAGWSAAAFVVTAIAGSYLTALAAASAYGAHGSGALSYPRTWGDFMVATGLAAFVAAACLSRATRQAVAARRSAHSPAGRLRAEPAWIAACAVIAVLVSGGVLYVSAANLHGLTGQYQARATHWDAENARITSEVSAGASTVRYLPLPLAGLAEPFTPAGTRTFAAGCFQKYYDVARVRPARVLPQPRVH
jgi:hypothetical protein